MDNQAMGGSTTASSIPGMRPGHRIGQEYLQLPLSRATPTTPQDKWKQISDRREV